MTGKYTIYTNSNHEVLRLKKTGKLGSYDNFFF